MFTLVTGLFERWRWTWRRIELIQYGYLRGDSFIAEIIAQTVWKIYANTKDQPVDLTHDQWLDILLEIYDGFTTRNTNGDLAIPDTAWVLFRRRFNDLCLHQK